MSEPLVNAAELTEHGLVELRRSVLAVASAGLRACDPGPATEAAVACSAAGVRVGEQDYPLAEGARVIVVGAGKATLAIAAALERRLGERLDGGAIAVRDDGRSLALERIEVLVADHPLPSERSLKAARRLDAIAADAGRRDLVLALFTGGSSALACLPPEGVGIGEKQRLHQVLLASGAPIAEVNTVRKHVSAIKGGRLAARAAPASLVNLVVSDVAGDVLETLTDPSVQDTSTPAEAIAVLRSRGLWEKLPEAVRAHLLSPAAESPKLEREPHSQLLVNGRIVCEAMTQAAQSLGLDARVVSTSLSGEASAVGIELAEIALRCHADGAPALLIGCGGESTVSLGSEDSFGLGGPNQEAALALAAALPGDAAVAACLIDTDGSDGGTEAAGAIVDGHTAARARAAGVEVATALATHRSGEALEALGDRVVTGPTHTNVNDLFAIAVGGSRRR